MNRRTVFMIKFILSIVFVINFITTFMNHSPTWWVWLFIAIILSFDTIRFAVRTDKENKWDQKDVYNQEIYNNEKAVSNSHKAGYIAYLVLMGCLVIGFFYFSLIDFSPEAIKLCAFLVFIGFMVWWLLCVYFHKQD